MINRRVFNAYFGSLLGILGLNFKIKAEERKLPVVKFDAHGQIENYDELTSGVPFVAQKKDEFGRLLFGENQSWYREKLVYVEEKNAIPIFVDCRYEKDWFGEMLLTSWLSCHPENAHSPKSFLHYELKKTDKTQIKPYRAQPKYRGAIAIPDTKKYIEKLV